MDKVKVALVGCGGVARNYRGVYGVLPECEVSMVVDIREEEAREAQAEVGAKRISSRFEDALDTDADVIVLSTPNDFHMTQAIAVLQSGKHLLIQKPIARTAAETEQILQIAAECGKQVGIYMNSLDHPLFHDLRDMVRQNRFGRMAKMRALLAHNQGVNWKGDIWRASKERTGGGSFIQLAVHYIHLLQWISNQDFQSAAAYSANLMCPHLEGDDITAALLQTESGALAEIGSGWCYNGEEVSLMGEKATVQYLNNDTLLVKADEPFHGRVIRYDTAGEWQVCTGVKFPAMGDKTNPLEQHRTFIQRLQAGLPPLVPGSDGLRDMKLVDAVHQSAAAGQFITVK
jgi:UDP-N-acetylglucosamine 3-dehydrogenase